VGVGRNSISQRVKTRRRILLAACLLLGAAGPADLAFRPLSRMNLPWWKQRFIEKQAELKRGPVDLLWLGDSITASWEESSAKPWLNYRPVWQRFYGDRHAVNLGFKGDTTAHLLWRIENGETDGIHPKAAVILIGANNFGKLHWPAAPTLKGVETIIAELQRRLPATRILLIGVLPSIRGPWVDQNAATLNAALAARYARHPRVTFQDVSTLFLKNGQIDPATFRDPLLTPPDVPLHPTAQTQARIADAIEPTLSTMLGDHNHLLATPQPNR
jgi:lysophospholipase L1-like esterase